MGILRNDRAVCVFVALSDPRRKRWVNVLVMAVIVPVPVYVPERLVRVRLNMPLTLNDPQRQEHHGTGCDLNQAGGLGEEGPCQHDAPEGGRREHHLSPRGAELLGAA